MVPRHRRLGFSSDVAILNASIAANAAGDVIVNFTASGTSMDPNDFCMRAGSLPVEHVTIRFRQRRNRFAATGAHFAGDRRSE